MTVREHPNVYNEFKINGAYCVLLSDQPLCTEDCRTCQMPIYTMLRNINSHLNSIDMTTCVWEAKTK